MFATWGSPRESPKAIMLHLTLYPSKLMNLFIFNLINLNSYI